MKGFSLPLVLALATAASAQDGTGPNRASVESFLTGLHQAAANNDDDAVLAGFDPTMIVRQDGRLTTYAEWKAIAEKDRAALKGKPLPKPTPMPRLGYDRIETIGERAIVDYTCEYPESPKGTKPQKVHAILAWRDGGWKIWRVDVA